MSGPGGFGVNYPPPDPHPSPYSPGGGQTISPGSITYTTSTGPDGKVIYHPFRYQTPSGRVDGIQWIPAEATQIAPTGAQPANAEFAASWTRGNLTRDDEKALKHWQRDEEKRRRKEEKQSAKRMAQYDRERRERDREEQELRGSHNRELNRRKSFNAGAPGVVAGYPTAGGGAGLYSPSAGAGAGLGTGAYGGGPGAPDLTTRFGDMGLDGGRTEAYERERNASAAYSPGPGAGLGRPRKYSVGDQDRRRSIYGGAGGGVTSPYAAASGGAYPDAAYPPANPYSAPTSAYPSSPNTRAADLAYGGGGSGYPPAPYSSGPGNAGDQYPRAASPYARAPSPYARPGSPYAPATSPYMGGGALSGAGPGPVYPRGHILEGQPIARSRAPSPVGGGLSSAYPGAAPAFPQPGIAYPSGPSPNMGGMAPLAGSGAGVYPGGQQEQLAAPEGFSRPINAAQPYTPFETMKVQDMDDFMEHIPRMPLVLQTHDVLHPDWIRLMQDLALAWSGKLPVPDFSRNGRPPKRSTLVADLLDLWNSSFFLARGVEAVLYKGRERRSGPNAGTVDRHLPAYDPDDSYSDDSSSDSSDSDSDSSDDNDRYRAGAGGYGGYGGQAGGDSTEARRRKKEKKREKRRRHKEKRARKKAKARENKYAIYLTYLPSREGGGGMMPGMPGGMPGGMGPGMGGLGMTM